MSADIKYWCSVLVLLSHAVLCESSHLLCRKASLWCHDTGAYMHAIPVLCPYRSTSVVQETTSAFCAIHEGDLPSGTLHSSVSANAHAMLGLITLAPHILQLDLSFTLVAMPFLLPPMLDHPTPACADHLTVSSRSCILTLGLVAHIKVSSTASLMDIVSRGKPNLFLLVIGGCMQPGGILWAGCSDIAVYTNI